MPRKANSVSSVTVKIRTTPGVVRYLEKLVGTEMYGKNVAEVAEQLLREALRRVYSDQAIAGEPPRTE